MYRMSILFLSFSISLTCCKKQEASNDEITLTPEYARGFVIHQNGDYMEIEVKQPFPNSTTSYRYLLIPQNAELPMHDPEAQLVRVPVKRMVCTSTSHIALLDLLEATSTLVGFPTTDLVSSPTARARIDSGYVTDLGMDSEINMESLLSIAPDMVMGYSITGDMIKLSKVKEMGIPVIINGEYLEDHPLGRAEWIKFMAYFLGREHQADSIFHKVKVAYETSKGLTMNIQIKPTVLTGILYGDTWFMPGGQNYASTMFQDAGYRYLWDDDLSTGFIKLSFESVYERGQDADYWIGVGSFGSMAELQNAEKRYALFKPFIDTQVYTYDARKGSTGGSEYLELGYSRPDIILKDLIKIAHPDLLPDHELYFHRRLE